MKRLRFISLWIACGFVAWGQTMGSFSHEFPYEDNTPIASAMAISGPLGLLVSSIMDHPYHWRVVPITAGERWKYFHEEFPELSREYFERTEN